MMEGIYIPYGAYWTSPFGKWQGSLSHLHSLQFAAHLCRREMEARNIPIDLIDYGVLGMSVPQTQCFYGLPWLTGLLGATNVGGPTIAQACATSARVLTQAAQEIESGAAECVLAVTTDRTSNGPQIYYPDPQGA
ncbi:MAG: thiolase family protein, partial [Anaerolineae bacterium]|nr:thiolase family protein [Anaerolineae bacterium]